MHHAFIFIPSCNGSGNHIEAFFVTSMVVKDKINEEQVIEIDK